MATSDFRSLILYFGALEVYKKIVCLVPVKLATLQRETERQFCVIFLKLLLIPRVADALSTQIVQSCCVVHSLYFHTHTK